MDTDTDTVWLLSRYPSPVDTRSNISLKYVWIWARESKNQPYELSSEHYTEKQRVRQREKEREKEQSTEEKEGENICTVGKKITNALANSIWTFWPSFSLMKYISFIYVFIVSIVGRAGEKKILRQIEGFISNNNKIYLFIHTLWYISNQCVYHLYMH